MTRASFRLTILLGILCVLNNCLGDIENDDLLKSYEEYFNKQNSNFTYEDGILYNVERQGTSRYKIEITIKVKDKFDSKSFRLLKCTATLNDDAGTLTVEENQCDDGTSGGRSANEAADVSSELDYTQDETTELTTTDSNVGRQALNLDSEVQSDNAQINNSGEQFVAIPRPQSSVPCIGCSSLVDNNAPGVDALANLAIRHLNKHTPDISYKLKFIVQVERQVQIVNGVRYIITINASPSNCGETLVEDCSGVKTCKVSILEKPWLKIPNGKKFRAVLSNNCTEQWLFGDDGEELSTKDEDLINTDDDIIKAKNNVDVQASPNSERKLTKEELNDLEDQIIPTNQINRQKRDVKYKTEGIKVLDPKEVYLLELAIEAFHKYSSEEVLRIRVVYATEQLSAYNKITRIDFNVKALETTLPNETNDVHTRCHTRVSEKDKNKKSFYTYCAIMDHENSIIEVPASNPIWRPIAEEKLESDYGELLQFNEIIRVYDDVINDNVNIIFDTKSSTNNAYRCHLTIQGDPNIPLVCIAIELGPVKKKEKDPTDLKYLHLASLALKKYLIQAHITEPYIVAVVSHASQLDGPLTDIDIDFISVDFDFTLRCISQVQENEELHIKKILVNCAKIPQRYDYPPKVIINRNPLDRKYVRIAREALKKYYPYVNYSNESLQIVYANEQVAGGVITRLDLDLNEERTATVHRCHVKLFEKVWENVSELSIDCFPKAQNIAGGRFEENASDPINWALARESLSKKYNSSLSLLEVVRLTTTSNGNSDTDFYAVSDSDKEVYQCHSSKLDQPWNKVSELKVECKPKHAKHIPISDGIVETDPSNPKYRAIAIVALAKEQLAYSNESLRVVYANEQIVSGVITRFDFDVREENNLTVYRCHVKLFEKAWEHVRELNIDCFPKAQNLPGGKLEQNASNPKNWELARESLSKKYNSSLSLLEVVRLTTAADGNSDTDYYAVSDSDKVYQCHSSIKLSALNVECKPKHTKHIPIPGEIIERDPSNPRYKAIAIEALAKVLQAYINKSLRVVYANEQIVRGVITRFDFDVTEGNNLTVYRCHVKLFEKAWEDVRDLNIDCFPKAENLPGGRFEKNASDPKNWVLAIKSLARKYNSSLSLLEVLRLTTTADGHFDTDFYAVSDSDKEVYQCHSSKLDQPWNKVSESKVECKPKYAKQIPIGGIVEKDPSNPKYKAIAIEALAKKLPAYSNESLRVVYANEQIVSGVITRFDFDVTEENNFTVYRCHVKLFEKAWEHVRELNIDCFPKAQNLPGGKLEQNASNPKNWELARESLSKKYNSSLSLLEVLRLTTTADGHFDTDFYAVSDSDKEVYQCHSSKLDQPWNKVSELKVECKPKHAKQIPTGGIVEKDPSNPKYKAIAIEALAKKLPAYSNESLRVVYANEQLVSGLITRFDFDVAEKNNFTVYRCHVKLFEKAWEHVRDLYIDCFPKAENLPGGRFEENASDPRNWELARESLSRKYNSSLSLLEVVRLTTTADGHFKTDFYAVSDSDKIVLQCHSSILDQPWNNVSESKVECKSGIIVTDPTNPKYKAIAIEALAKEPLVYSNESLRVVYSNEQSANGLITRFDFDVAEKYNFTVFRCHVKLFEKPWKHIRDLNIDCFPKALNLPGGRFEQNASDPRNWHDARNSLANQFDTYLSLVDVLRVTTRDENGGIHETDFKAISISNNVLYRCHNIVFTKAWEKLKGTELICHPVLQKNVNSALINGIVKKDPSDPKFYDLARKSLTQYLAKANNSKPYRVALVTQVSEQVSEAVSINIHFIAVLDDHRDIFKCFSNIWEESFVNRKVIKVHCSSLLPKARNKRMPGGKQNRDPKNPIYLLLAKKALRQYLNTDSVETQYRIIIEEVTTTVVNGLSTDINFTAIAFDKSGLHYRCLSNILEQGWVNTIVINVNCIVVPPVLRKKRHVQIVGGKTPQNPNDPKYLALARQSLRKYLKGEDISAYQIIVEKVTTQVVAGIITDIDFLAKSQTSPSGLKCRSEILERLWENSTKINVDCSPDRPVGRKKRYDKLIGGKTPQDPNNPKYLALARQSLRKYLKGEDISAYQITVEKVTTQVVAGIITDIEFLAKSQTSPSGLKCRSEILERVWENSTTINVDCSPDRPVGRKKRYDKLIGGKTPQDPNNPKYLALARQSLQKYLKGEDISAYQITVEKVTTQVVAGIITDIDFLAKSQTSPSGLKCRSEIFERVWENSTKTKVDCSPDQPVLRKKRHVQIVGGKTPQNPNDPKYLALARQSLQKYLKGEDISAYQIIVEKVTTQVVAGIITDIDFLAKSQTSPSGLKCRSEILERLWENSTKINVDCSPDRPVGRKKRYDKLIGGKTPQDPNNPKYLALARQSLRKYLKGEDISAYQITVEKVTTQVVAGIITDIEFLAKSQTSPSGLKCRSEILERVWENSTTINVDCSPDRPVGRKKRYDKLIGGKTPQDPNNPKYLALARQSLQKYLKGEDISAYQITVEKVTTQVVAGIITDIDFLAKSQTSPSGLKCRSEIFERVWENSTKTKVDCSPDQPLGRKKRHDKLIGGKTPQDPNDPKYLALAKKSFSQYQKEGPDIQYQITVEQVTTTPVSGLLTEIYYVAVEKDGFASLTCYTKIWEQLWLNSTKIDVECNPLPREERSVHDLLQDNEEIIKRDLRDASRLKRSIGSTKILNDESLDPINNEDLIKADYYANEALKHIDAMYRHPRQMKVISIFSFTKDPKEHASAHYRIKMEVGYTNCLALSPTVGSCSFVTDMGASKFCRVSIWLQPDRDHPPRFKVSCDIDENEIETNKKAQAEQLFFDFLVAHKPTYLNNFEEMKSRLEMFKRNIEKIHELNTHERGTARYGVSKFTDLNEEEFSNKYLGLKPHLASSNSMTSQATIPNVALPASFDWREKGAVTEVKNQGACGSCWAFSVTGNIEGQWKLKSGQLVSLSEQELVDCDTLDQGCNGGLPDNAYRAIEQLGGLETEQDYPYEMEKDKCSFNKTMSKVQISGAVNITSNETSMAMWMVEHGPISIGINANAMQFYMGGVSHPWKALCNPKNLDHGVLIVGFGIKEYPLFKKSLPYWIVKNSWGPSWGEQGYYRIYRGDGSCGVNQMASSAIIN